MSGSGPIDLHRFYLWKITFPVAGRSASQTRMSMIMNLRLCLHMCKLGKDSQPEQKRSNKPDKCEFKAEVQIYIMMLVYPTCSSESSSLR